MPGMPEKRRTSRTLVKSYPTNYPIGYPSNKLHAYGSPKSDRTEDTTGHRATVQEYTVRDRSTTEYRYR